MQVVPDFVLQPGGQTFLGFNGLWNGTAHTNPTVVAVRRDVGITGAGGATSGGSSNRAGGTTNRGGSGATLIGGDTNRGGSFGAAGKAGAATAVGISGAGGTTSGSITAGGSPGSSGTGVNNVAQDKTATASSSASGNPPANGNDSSSTTSWCASNGNVNEWWMVDLGATYNLTGTEVTWPYSGRIYQYTIGISVDGTNFTEVVDQRSNTRTSQSQSDSLVAQGRYLRLTVVGLPTSPVTVACISDLKAFGTIATGTGSGGGTGAGGSGGSLPTYGGSIGTAGSIALATSGGAVAATGSTIEPSITVGGAAAIAGAPGIGGGASGGLDSEEFFIELPSNLSPEQVTLASYGLGGSLVINDGVSVVGPATGFANVTSVHTSIPTELGVATEVNNLYSESDVFVRGSHIHGNLKTMGALVPSPQLGSTIDGTTSQHSSLDPVKRLAWTINFPKDASGISLGDGESKSIDPGAFGDVTLGKSSHLKLNQAGIYVFDGSLILEPDSVIEVENSTHPVELYVRGSFIFRGAIQKTAPIANLLIGVAGTTDIPIERPFDAILVAPHGSVQLGTSTGGHFTSIYAKSILVRPHSQVTQAALQMDEFCTGGASRLGLCAHNCLADGDCSAGSSCQSGVCGCAATATDQCSTGEPCTKNSDCQSGLVCGIGQSDRYATPWNNACLPSSCLEKLKGASGCGNVLAPCGVCPACQKADGCSPPVYAFTPPDPSSEVAGAIDGTFDVSEGGTATYTIPISVPPGRGDMTPSLALVYDSSGRQELLAEGWQLTGFSYVTRCVSPASPAGKDLANPKKRRGIRGTKDDQLCLDGQQLVRQTSLDGSDGGHGYTTALDSFKRIRAYGPEGADAWYFKVWTPEGRILTYGARTLVEGMPLDANGTVFLDLKSGTARVWALNRIEDQSGNFIDYIYEKNDGGPGNAGVAFCDIDPTSCATTEIWPKEIRYTGSSSKQPTRRIEFVYDVGLAEPVTTYVAGVKVVRNHLLNRINLWIDSTNSKSYLLENVLTDGNVYELKRLWECSLLDTPTGKCKQPTQFRYFDGTGFETGAINSGVSLNPSNESQPDAQFVVWDANGDGMDDLITAQDYDNGRGGQWAQLTMLYRPDNTFGATKTVLPYFQHHGMQAAVGNREGDWQGLLRQFHQGSVLDLDSDGFDDLVDTSPRGQPFGEGLKGGAAPGAYVLSDYSYPNRPPLEFPNGSLLENEGLSLPASYFLDVDGDGLADAILHNANTGEIQWRRNIGGGLFENPMFFDTNDSKLIFPIDLDGDGAQEIVSQPPGSVYGGSSRILNWEGNVQVPFFDMNSTCCDRNWMIGSVPQDVLPIDVNGDGLKDVLVRGPEVESPLGGPARIRFYLSTGKGLKEVENANLPSMAHNVFSSMRVLDYDADGREEAIVWTGEKWVAYRWSNADVANVEWNFKEVVIKSPDSPPGIFSHLTRLKTEQPIPVDYPWTVAADVNGDGALDLVVVDPNKRVQFYLAKTAKSHMLRQVIDGLGEMTEVAYDSGRPGTQQGYARSSMPATHLSTTKLLNRVSRPIVSKVSVYHQDSPTSGIFDHGSEYQFTDARVDYAGRGWLGFDSKRVTHINGNGEEIQWEHVTYDLNESIVSPIACTDTSCGDLPSVDEDPWRYPYAGVPTSVQTQYDVVSAEKEIDAARRISRTVENEWSHVTRENLVNTTGRRGFLYLYGRKTTEKDESVGSGTYKRVISVIDEQFDHDSAGNVKSHEVWTFSGANRVEHTLEESKYVAPDTDRWLLRLPSDVTTTRTRGETVGPNISDFSGEAQSRSVHYEYNAQGLLTSIQRGGQPLTTKLIRNAYGNVQRVERSGAEMVTRVAVVDQFDADDIYPLHLTIQPNVNAEAAGEPPLQPHTAVIGYDSRFGVLTSLADTNGLSETWYYDGFGRLLRHELPEGSVEVVTYSAATADSSGALSVPAVFKTTTTLDGGGQSSVEIDSLGRTVRSSALGIAKVLSTGVATTTNVVQETTYDANGRVYQVARPHVPGDNSQGFVTYSYNALDELTSVVQPDGTTITYDRAEAVSLDPSVASGLDLEQHDSLVLFRTELHVDVAAVETRIFDVGGQLTQSIDADGGTIKYEYDGTGGLRTIDAPHGKTTRSYDAVGRLLAEDDPDRGLHEYTYNAFDEVRTHTGPGVNGSSTRLVDAISYDPYGRLTRLENVDGVRRWQYDQAATGIGKLSAELVQSGGVTKSQIAYTYDSYGRLKTVSQRIAEVEHTLGIDYNHYGQVQFISYPSVGAAAFKVENVYDSQSGQVTEVRDASSSSNRYWRLAENYQGYLPQVEYIGPVAKTTRQYYPQTGLPKRILTEATSGPVQDESYEFDRHRNLISRENSLVAGGKQSFEFDLLNRLLAAYDASGTVIEKLEYDSAGTGNIMSKLGIGSYDYGPIGGPRPHAVKSTTGGRSYEYDDSGNQIGRHGGPQGDQLLKYNLFGLPFEIATGSGEAKRITSLEYGPNGERLGKHRYRLSNPDDSASTRIPESLRIYVAGLYELRSNCSGGSDGTCSNPSRTHVYRVYGGGHEVAQVHRDEGAESTITAQRTYFLHPDQLGSTSVITAGDDGAASTATPGTVLRSQEFSPFGKATVKTAGAAAVFTGFTGLEEDAEEGLVNANGRIYDPELGRFISPDPTTPFAGWSQGHNPYSYALNNPLSWVDPTGFEPDAPGAMDATISLSPDLIDPSNPQKGTKSHPNLAALDPPDRRRGGTPVHRAVPSKSNGSSGGHSNGGGESTSRAHGDPSQPGSADNAKGTTPQPASGATETGSGKPGAILDEVKVNAGNKGKIGEPSTVADKGAFIIGMLGFTPPSDNGVSGGIPGGHCEGARCSSGAGPQALWSIASLFGAKIVSKAQGMWSSVKAGALHASELAEKVADRAAERLSSAISRVTRRGGAGAKIGGELSLEAQRGIRSLEKQIARHEQKLAEFRANPTVRPGMENLPKELIERQQRVRIRHLEREIETFRSNIDKLKSGGQQ